MTNIVITTVYAADLTWNGQDVPQCPICQAEGTLKIDTAEVYPCNHYSGVQFTDGFMDLVQHPFTHIVNVIGYYAHDVVEKHHFNQEGNRV